MYAYIPDRFVVSVGDLPESALNLYTGDLVVDLDGVNAHWAVPCGYFDVDDPDLSANLDAAGLTGIERDAALAVIAAAVALNVDRLALIDDTMVAFRSYIEANNSWAGSVTPDPVADFSDWATYVNDQLFAVTGHVNALLESSLLIIPTISEALAQLGLVQVVSVRMDQSLRWFRATTSITVS